MIEDNELDQFLDQQGVVTDIGRDQLALWGVTVGRNVRIAGSVLRGLQDARAAAEVSPPMFSNEEALVMGAMKLPPATEALHKHLHDYEGLDKTCYQTWRWRHIGRRSAGAAGRHYR